MKKLSLLLSASLISAGLWAQVPKADLLDVVFHADGTATDASAAQLDVQRHGSPTVVQSLTWQIPVFCAAGAKWASTPENYFTVQVSDEMWEAMADGHTMECMARPYWDGGIPADWVSLMGMEQDGGAGITITGGRWLYESHMDGKYREAASNGSVERGEWTHLVGVMDPAAQQIRLYANGKLVTVNDAATAGALTRPKGDGPLWMGIGCDYTVNDGVPEHAFRGDIALARVYSEPLTDEQVAALWAEVAATEVDCEEHKEESEYADLRYSEDGFILVANAEELYKAACLSQENEKMNVRLEADIDYTEYNQVFTKYPTAFKGVFDGQGHTVHYALKDVGYTSGFISVLEKGSLVKDLSLTGTMTTSMDYTSPLLGMNNGGTVQNVTVSVDVTNTFSGYAYCGGLSSWDKSGSRYENCASYCIMEASGDGIAGLTAVTAGAAEYVNCVSACQISAGNPSWCGPLVAWINGGSITTNNVYYINPADLPERYGEATRVDEEMMASGKVCLGLNRGSINQPVWRQTLGEDKYPVMDADHAVVFAVDEEYMNLNSEADIQSAAGAYAQYQRSKTEGVEAYTVLLENLEEMLTKLEASTTWESLVYAYDSVRVLDARIQENVAAYAQLREQGSAVYARLQSMEGEYVSSLLPYFEEDMEPCEEYPLGSYAHVMEYFSLDTEDVRAMMEEVALMEKKATALEAAPGTDVTVLLENADFANGFQGWAGQKMTGTGTNGNMNAAECYAAYGFDMYQKLTGLRNGFYRLQVNGAYRPFNDVHANQYYPSIYLNGVMNYLQTDREGMIPVEEAVDKENCWIAENASVRDLEVLDNQGNLLGYALHGIQSCCYAFQVGRYPNSIIVEVTDGELTVGVRHPYSNYGGNEWVGIGNICLTYEGTLEEASEALDLTLASMCQRVTTMQTYEFDFGENYEKIPNFSQSLKNQLAAVAEKATAGDLSVAEKYELVKTLSGLFQQTIDSKRAYVDMARALVGFADRIPDYPTHYEELETMCDEAWDEWTKGAYATEEEIDAKVKQMLDFINGLEIEMPEADVLDLVFNASEGTVTDQSAMHNEVIASEGMKVVHSPKLDMDVLCMIDNNWGDGKAVSYARVPLTETLWDAVSDGHTMECYLRPTWNEAEQNANWVTVVGMEEFGGFGMIKYNGKWMYEAHVNGYQDAVYDGSVAKDEWIHLVGVWNKDDGTLNLYVNGVLQGSTNVSGGLGRPTLEESWLGIGGDLSPNEVPTPTMKGDLAIVRIYDKPLNASQISVLWRNVQMMDTGEEEHSDGATGIKEIKDASQESQDIYNLMGQKVKRVGRGIYIRNGKKYLNYR